jgi:DNA replicative helicase MCM subunit Mcm2 (Cdc46/Mcm family)
MQYQTIYLQGGHHHRAARCYRDAIVAATNPIIPLQQNVELTEPVLSHFVFLFIVEDTLNPVQDGLVARFVLGSQQRCHPGVTWHKQTSARRSTPRQTCTLQSAIFYTKTGT